MENKIEREKKHKLFYMPKLQMGKIQFQALNTKVYKT